MDAANRRLAIRAASFCSLADSAGFRKSFGVNEKAGRGNLSRFGSHVVLVEMKCFRATPEGTDSAGSSEKNVNFYRLRLGRCA
jgi:hypothetical protein